MKTKQNPNYLSAFIVVINYTNYKHILNEKRTLNLIGTIYIMEIL